MSSFVFMTTLSLTDSLSIAAIAVNVCWHVNAALYYEHALYSSSSGTYYGAVAPP